MSVDAGISSRPRQVLVLTVWDVEMGLRVAVFLGQTKVNHIDLVSAFPNPHQEVVRLDITMDERLGMDVLDSRDELVRKKQDSLQGEFAVAEVEEVFQAGSQEIKDHGVVVTFRPEPADKGDSHSSCQRFVHTCFIFELWMLGFDALKLDGDLFSRDDVGT